MDYFISVALMWDGYTDLSAYIDKVLAARIPTGHVMVPPSARHSTLFAIAKLNRFDLPNTTPAEAMQAVFGCLPFEEIEQLLRKHLTGRRVQATEFRIYENTSNIQFQAQQGVLPGMREELSGILANARLDVSGVDVEFPMKDDRKNKGDLLFGSFARRVELKSDNQQLQREPITGIDWFAPKGVQITVSNAALTNVRMLGQDYKVVAL